MGDEVVLIYEATGRVIKPGGLPIDENVVVYNVETMYNLYRAVHLNIPVTNKLVSIVGEIDHPLTVRVPLGTIRLLPRQQMRSLYYRKIIMWL